MSGLGGALIGGLCTLVGVLMQVKAGDVAQTRSEDIQVKAILQALHDELVTLYKVYRSTIGDQIAAHPSGQPFLFHWPLSSEYFSIYHGNAVFIGRLNDNALRKSIIQAYTYAKSLIDSVGFNNTLIGKLEQSFFVKSQAPTDVNEQMYEWHRQQLTRYSDELKVSHELLVRGIEDTLRRLRKAGVLSEHNR